MQHRTANGSGMLCQPRAHDLHREAEILVLPLVNQRLRPMGRCPPIITAHIPWVFSEWFASTYSLVVSIFFMLMGVRFMSDPFGATYEVFPTLPVDSCKDWQTASVHMFFVVGFCTFTFGFLMLAQRVLRLSVTSTLTMFTAIWCVYTEFERHLGSPVRAKGFKAPPVGVTAVTGMMALVGLYAAFKGNAKIKED